MMYILYVRMGVCVNSIIIVDTLSHTMDLLRVQSTYIRPELVIFSEPMYM